MLDLPYEALRVVGGFSVLAVFARLVRRSLGVGGSLSMPQFFLSPEASAEGDARAFFEKLDFQRLEEKARLLL
jgi:hypothetical protein